MSIFRMCILTAELIFKFSLCTGTIRTPVASSGPQSRTRAQLTLLVCPSTAILVPSYTASACRHQFRYGPHAIGHDIPSLHDTGLPVYM
ncbi:hypothetical protein B0H14DRAFT_3458980 [Mycena olivaceomarginata]|nr:hypothetical protein B0H14DRAFT_3458980 [Mycena olivaceomarginata]